MNWMTGDFQNPDLWEVYEQQYLDTQYPVEEETIYEAA